LFNILRYRVADLQFLLFFNAKNSEVLRFSVLVTVNAVNEDLIDISAVCRQGFVFAVQLLLP